MNIKPTGSNAAHTDGASSTALGTNPPDGTALSGASSEARVAGKGRLSRSTLWMALAGAVGGYLGHNLVGALNPFGPWPLFYDNAFEAFRNQSFYHMCAGLMIGAAILICDNNQSLRGRWHRDLLPGLAVFGGLGLVAGALGDIGQGLLGGFPVIATMMLTGVAGMGIGAGVGLLRKDRVQARQGAIGGLIGGAIAGIFLDAAYANNPSLESVAAASRNGTIVTGALIGLFMRVVQDALKKSWLVAVSPGPYEGKQYPLNGARVTVGRSELDDISLYRKSELTMPSGALVFENGKWLWQGEVVEINGVAQTHAALAPGDELKFGATIFRFQSRSRDSAPADSVLAPAPAVLPSMQAGVPAAGLTAGAANKTGWALVGSGGSIPISASPSRHHIGRADHNEIVINDPSVSSAHAVIEVGTNTLNITDVGSTNGVTVNERRIPVGVDTTLKAGDSLTLGEQKYRVERR